MLAQYKNKDNVDHRHHLPLTLRQRDIFFDQLHFGKSPKYNIGGKICLGDICLDQIRQAHEKLLRQHQAFSMNIHIRGGEVTQSFGNQVDYSLPLIKFEHCENPEAEAQAWIDQAFASYIPIDEGVLHRSYILQLSERNYWYVGKAHHLMIDGWGFANWVKDLATFYNGRDCDDENGEDWLQLIDTEHSYFNSKQFSKDKAFWLESTQTLSSPMLESQYESQSSTVIQSRRDVISLNKQKYRDLIGNDPFVKSHIHSYFMSIIALYFHKIYDKTQFFLGVPSHNRRTAKMKEVIGLYFGVNLINVDFSTAVTFKDLMLQLQATQRKTLRHKMFPMGELAKSVGKRVNPELYEIGFNYLKLEGGFCFEGQAVDYFYETHNHETVPFNFTLWEIGEEHIELHFDYCLSYFSPQDIALLKARVLDLLGQVSRNIDVPISQLNKLSAQDRHMHAQLRNQNSDCNLQQHFVDLFSDGVIKFKDKVAARGPSFELSYHQLDEKSTKLAHLLSSRGVQQGDLVGLILPRDERLILSLLAIQKLGAAFLPIDPSYPQSRISYMLEDAKVDKLLTMTAGVRPTSDIGTVILFDAIDMILSQSGNPVRVNKQNDDLAYVLYTSGSSGKPKGVEITHGALSNFIQSMVQQPGLKPSHKLLAVTPISFDISLLELLAPLAAGAELYLYDKPISQDIADFSGVIERESIDFLQMTPSGWKLLLAAGWQGNQDMIALVGGESLPRSLADTLQQHVAELWNMYGPTETTIWSTCKQVVGAFEFNNIGKPIANTEIRILDKYLQALPVNMFGDLYIAGAGVAKGYLGQEALTSSKFINIDGQIFYQTGDIARVSHSGDIEYQGRADNQVKLNGYRIELDEIVSALLKVPDITDAVCKIETNETNRQQLVAYYCGGTNFEQNQLRAWLSETLPAPFVPSAFMQLQQLPLTPNGKVDIKSLPKMTAIKPIMASVCDDDVSATQSVLLEICAEILNNSQLSIEDNFFEIGGNSQDMLEMTSVLNQRLSVNLNIVDLFSNPSIVKLSRFIDGQTVPNKKIPQQRKARRQKGAGRVNERLEKRLNKRKSRSEV